MKKILMIGVLVAVIGLALGVAGYGYAQSQNPTPQPGYGPGMMGGGGRAGYGPGMMGGGRGMMGGQWSGEYGPVHTYMIAALADGLDLSVEELEERIAAGETPYTIAQAQGLSAEQIQQLFQTAHTAALAQAVAAGVITQEQADWMNQHMAQMGANGYGPGSGSCHGGGRGPRAGQP